MSEDPFVETGPRGLVSVTLKAGQYEAPWIVAQPDTIENTLRNIFGYELKQGESPLVALMAQAASAQAAFMRTYVKAKEGKPAEPSTYGKPDGADKSTATDLPFADSGVGDTSSSKARTCQHGDRIRAEHNGKVGWLCATKPKGDPERCATVFE